MTSYTLFGLLSPIVAALGYIPYVYSIYKGTVKPHPFSWLLWSILGSIVLFFYYTVGARDTLPLAILNFIGPTIIFFFSLRNWIGGFSRFDYVCLCLSLASIIVYLIFHDASFSLSISLLADVFAFMPTFRKSYIDPASENRFTWGLFFLGDALSLFAVSNWTYAIALFPIYMTVVNGVNFVMVVLGRRLKKA